MHKITPWMFLVIALMWLLPFVTDAASWMDGVAIIAMALAGIMELTSK